MAASVVVGLVSLIVNGALIARLKSEPGFGGMEIAFVYIPVSNGVLLVLFAACIPLVKRAGGGASIALYVTLSISLPLLAIPFDVFIGRG